MPRKTRRGVRRLAAVLALAVLAAGWCGLRAALPDTFTLAPGEKLRIAALPFVQAGPAAQGAAAAVGAAEADASANRTLRLFGVVPVKTVRTVEQARRTVSVQGTPFGVKMFADGALVVAFSDQYTALGTENPAKEAGLRLGDLIVSAGGQPVRNNEELAAAIAAAGGAAIEIVYTRDGETCTTTLAPVADRDTGTWRAGVWVRDSSAGIGTLTFTDPEAGSFAGLGHAVSDADTGTAFTLLSGEIVAVAVTGVQKGAAGAPGALRGEFAGDTLGTIAANDATGVYGRWQGAHSGTAMPIAYPQEVAPGPAEILATVDGGAPRRYAVEIERVNLTAADPNRNLLIRVVDDALLQTTGGIVQGMSGSPVLQDGRLVGALTHVLVNDPVCGYGIFADTMLTRADAAVR